MSELAQIENQLQRSFEGEAWHGPAVLELLRGVTHDQAAAHPITGVHSIWELVLHLGGAYRLVLRRLHRDATPLGPEEDWPSMPSASADNWQAAVAELIALNEAARRAVAGFDLGRLDDPLVEQPPYSAYTQFIGLTQHDLYHAGQIAILKKAISSREPTG